LPEALMQLLISQILYGISAAFKIIYTFHVIFLSTR
jgi:hypothetical protein